MNTLKELLLRHRRVVIASIVLIAVLSYVVPAYMIITPAQGQPPFQHGGPFPGQQNGGGGQAAGGFPGKYGGHGPH